VRWLRAIVADRRRAGYLPMQNVEIRGIPRVNTRCPTDWQVPGDTPATHPLTWCSTAVTRFPVPVLTLVKYLRAPYAPSVRPRLRMWVRSNFCWNRCRSC